MRGKARRRLLQWGAVTALAPFQTLSMAQPARVARADDFRSGALKGFMTDTVRSRGSSVDFYDALASTGANVFRIFFPFRKCKNCGQYGRSPEDIASLERILAWAVERKMRVVVTGDFEDADKPFFWSHASLRASVVDNWRWFAGQFGNHPGIAGLDLLNGPNPPWPGSGPKVAEGHALWRPLAAEAIAAIRSQGVSLPVIYEGIGGGQSIGLRDLVPFDDPNVVYSVHVYTPHDITHQQVGDGWKRTIPYPAGPEWKLADFVLYPGGWDRKRLEEALKDTIAFQKRYNVPIYVGEFSCVRWAPGKSAQRYVADCLAIFRQYGWSWSYHEFRGWYGWDAEVDSEDQAARARSMDAPVMAMLRAEIATAKR